MEAEIKKETQSDVLPVAGGVNFLWRTLKKMKLKLNGVKLIPVCCCCCVFFYIFSLLSPNFRKTFLWNSQMSGGRCRRPTAANKTRQGWTRTLIHFMGSLQSTHARAPCPPTAPAARAPPAQHIDTCAPPHLQPSIQRGMEKHVRLSTSLFNSSRIQKSIKTTSQIHLNCFQLLFYCLVKYKHTRML